MEYIPLILCSWLGFTSIAYLLPASMEKSKGYEMRSRVVSTVHAIISTYLSIRAVWEIRDKFWTEDFFFLESTHAGRTTIAVTLGYFACDVFVFLALDRKILDVPMIIHHFISILGFGVSLFEGFSQLWSVYILANEASTPFVNIHFMFTRHRTDAWKAINGFMMWLSYLVMRLVWNTVMVYAMVATSSPRVYTGMNFYKACLTALIVLTSFFLNIAWFKQITVGLVKAVRGKPAATAAPPQKVAPPKGPVSATITHDSPRAKVPAPYFAAPKAAAPAKPAAAPAKPAAAPAKPAAAPAKPAAAPAKNSKKDKKSKQQKPGQQQAASQVVEAAPKKKEFAEGGEGWTVIGLRKRKTKTDNDD